ncbi:RNA-guided endonuclease TnpB family protein [cf. Phormidesmis sp. LEGE 11477]|uniref:RNA-guided endonuclease InsQ/TnpB family protein n=1 Tax=cf. Phormidesmis sp. LEGE 11477 TaxID=1828680 RepID=UPI00188044B3|nr:RNA-guided endonuclease TnpB family protein [cf. Phormidesmis sp. LEGE 11477]MBE9064486.1 transposase [cf. Phormidesmis sp. LEGE 11477]
MKIAYQYKLLPTYEQRCQMTRWLDMLRAQYNWLLGERFDWWEMNRCAVNACPLTCSIALPKERPDYYAQKRSLSPMKKVRPWYKELPCHTLQEVAKRVDLAFSRFIQGDSSGKRSGKPRFKGKGRYRTMLFTQLRSEHISSNRITLPKLGKVKFIRHRPMPAGFALKRALVTLKADGWYVSLTLEDKRVPDTPIVDVEPTEANSIGIDAGLEYFVAGSDGSGEPLPKFYRQAETKLGRLQAKREHRPKGSKGRRKLNERIAKLHQKVARQRQQWHYEVAGRLLDKADVVFVEDLRVSNMARKNKPKQAEDGAYLPNGQAAKSGLNKSFADAGIAGFLTNILPYKAAKAGKRVVEVSPAGTSQHCASCLSRVPKGLSDRWHDCPHCGFSCQRDINSGILIKQVGLGIASLKNAKSRANRDGEARALCLA